MDISGTYQNPLNLTKYGEIYRLTDMQLIEKDINFIIVLLIINDIYTGEGGFSLFYLICSRSSGVCDLSE